MSILILATVLLYILSAAAYMAYFFVQKEPFQRVGYVLISAGFVAHTGAIVIAFTESGRIPVHNLQETLVLAAWTVSGLYLVVHFKYRLKVLGAYAAPLSALVMAVSSIIPRGSAQPNDIFKSFWLISHIVTIFIGEAAFALACGLGVLYLVQEHAIKSKNPGFFFKRLPSLDLIDTTGYACIVIGFTLLTIGLITGFVYAKSVWGRFWSWDPKEVWSGITWLLYAALLHERLAAGWRGRRSAIMAILGFAALLFTFLGVNFLLKGHHGGFTRFY